MAGSVQTVRLGTRGSLLARTQSQLVASSLEKIHPGLEVELVIFKTAGDKITSKPLYEIGGKGLFTQDLEEAVLAKQIEFAVHSFKDVPVTMPLVDQSELVVPAVPQREDPRDCLVCLNARTLADLPPNARVGTGSLRRRCQVLQRRPDLTIEPIRGNIDTRLKKLRDGKFDAVILAAAGLRRTGLFDEAEMTMIPPDQLLPAPAQGALALQCHQADHQTRDLLMPLNDAEAQACVTVERALVAALRGDCHSPIAALAEINDGNLTLKAAVGKRDGQPPVLRAFATAPLNAWQDAVAAVMKLLTEQGVMRLLTQNP